MTARPPSVSALLESDDGRALAAAHGHKPAVAAIRAAIEAARRTGSFDPADLLASARSSFSSGDLPRLRPVWNLTGVVLHTNLGRAILPEKAVAAATAAMAHPVAVEYDLASGKRGERDSVLRDHLRANAADRDLYERTKRELIAQDWPDMNAYADAKTEVIEAIIQTAPYSGFPPALNALAAISAAFR